MPQDRYEEWAQERREELRLTYQGPLIEVARLYEEREGYEMAIEALRQVVAAEPTHEEAHAGARALIIICAVCSAKMRSSAYTADSGRCPICQLLRVIEGLFCTGCGIVISVTKTSRCPS